MKRSVIIVSAACLLAACTQKELNKFDIVPSPVVFTAETEGSRTFVNGATVCWAADDSISVFGRGFSNAKFIYTGEAGSDHGTFASGLGGPGGFGSDGLVCAVYPYDASNSFNEQDSELGVWFPLSQDYTVNSFGPDAAVMVAASTDNNLQFKHACGFLKIPVYGDCQNPILAVVIEGNNGELLSGLGLVKVSTVDDPTIQMDTQSGFTDTVVYDGSGSIVLDPSPSNAVDIWFTLPPTDFTGGITVTIYDEQFNKCTITSTNPLSIRRGVLKETSPVEVVIADDPTLKDYDVDSYDESSELEQAADWYGTWNYYANDFFEGTGIREYQGKVTISPSSTPTEGPDKDGYYDEYVYVDGLFPYAPLIGPYYEVDTGNCVLEMDVYAGIMYSFAKTTVDGKCSVYLYTEVADTWYSAGYYSAFIPVAPGYFAFVDVSFGSYNFEAIGVYAEEYFWDAYSDLLLVDPAVDANQVGSSSVEAAVAKARASFASSAREVSHIPFACQKDFAKAAIDNYKRKLSFDSKPDLKDRISRLRSR